MNSRSALDDGYPHLARWLRRAERLWNDYKSSNITLTQQLDYYGKLTSQFPISPIRVVYAASGTLPCALVVQDRRAVIEHAAYWSPVKSIEEGRYLVAILNSEAARLKIAALQAQGQWGARHFDKVMFTLPIPRYDSKDQLHQDLASAAEKAETAAGLVNLDDTQFQRARRLIRNALVEAGVAPVIENLVTALLNQRGNLTKVS